MEKCQACSKTTLLPEQIGSAIICKKCLLKINGLMWKYRKIDKNKTLEKEKSKALEKAKMYQFPEEVILGINEFFLQQQAKMLECEACGEVTASTKKMGKSIICKKCFSKIDKEEWNNLDYFDKKELDAEKDKVIKIAKKNNFPAPAIDFIKEHFDKKIKNGWLYTIEGVTGQTLSVFEDYIVIKTTEDFYEEEIRKQYTKLVKGNSFELKEIGTYVLGDLARFKNPLSAKNMLKTATNIAVNKIENSNKKENTDFYVRKGNKQILYKDYDSIGIRMPNENEEIGFIVISNSKNASNSSNNFFFFKNYTDTKTEINKVYPFIEDKIINKQVIESSKEETEKRNSSSISEELRELKSLLDDGIITEEDFEKKKKQILGL